MLHGLPRAVRLAKRSHDEIPVGVGERAIPAALVAITEPDVLDAPLGVVNLPLSAVVVDASVLDRRLLRAAGV